MTTDCKELHLRLAAAGACVLLLTLLYVRALAGAAAFGTYSSFVHPWRSIISDILMFGFSATALVFLSSVARYGSWLQRVGAFVLGLLPAWVLGHFFLWLLGCV
jgi:hypothetical protein